MTAALLHGHEIPPQETSTTTPTSDERDDFMQRAAGRGRILSIGGIVAGGLVVGAGIGLSQEAQRNAVNDIQTDNVMSDEQFAQKKQDQIDQALQAYYDQSLQVGDSFKLTDQNPSIYQQTVDTLNKAGINTATIDLGPALDVATTIANTVPQAGSSYTTVETDINHDGKKEYIPVPTSQVIDTTPQVPPQVEGEN